jgi:hypothetical protein
MMIIVYKWWTANDRTVADAWNKMLDKNPYCLIIDTTTKSQKKVLCHLMTASNEPSDTSVRTD